jgi:FtsZ-binding cell division protein ZapB
MVKISDIDWDALDEEVTNTDYSLDDMRPVPPEMERRIQAAADVTLREMELEELRATQEAVQSKQASIQVEIDSLRSRIDDLVLAHSA